MASKVELVADFALQEGREKLVKDIEIRGLARLLSKLYSLPHLDGNYLLCKQVGLNAPILSQLHDGILNELLVVAQQLHLACSV